MTPPQRGRDGGHGWPWSGRRSRFAQEVSHHSHPTGELHTKEMPDAGHWRNQSELSYHIHA
jgi:hypothetical protein